METALQSLKAGMKRRQGQPKFRVFRRTLEERIREMSHGERIPSIRHLQRQYRISLATVNRALKELEAGNVIVRRWGSGIYVNKGKLRRNHMVGVLVPDIADMASALLYKGIQESLMGDDYLTLLCNGCQQFGSELDSIRAMLEKSDATVVLPTTVNIHNPEYIRFFNDQQKQGKLPFLFVDLMPPGASGCFIGLDNFKAFREAARELLAGRRPFRQIVYLGAMESVVGIDRLNGLRAGLTDAGQTEDCLTVLSASFSRGRWTFPPLPSATGARTVYFVANPHLLWPVVECLRERQVRVPEDAVVVSVVEDSQELSSLPIVRLIKPSIRVGIEAARLIRNLIAGKTVPLSTRLDLKMDLPEALKKNRRSGGL